MRKSMAPVFEISPATMYGTLVHMITIFYFIINNIQQCKIKNSFLWRKK